jgi:hypothetical protein
VEFVGLARVPRRVAAALSGAASSASLAAAELYALGRGATDDARLAGIVADVKRSSDEAIGEAAQMLGGGVDRDDVIAIAQSLRLMADRIAEAAAAVVRFGPSHASWEALAGVERDLAREVTGLVGELDGRPKATDQRFERVEALHQEGRRLLRAARATLLTQDDPVAAVMGQSVLDRIELAMLASRESARTVRRVLVKHQ